MLRSTVPLSTRTFAGSLPLGWPGIQLDVGTRTLVTEAVLWAWSMIATTPNPAAAISTGIRTTRTYPRVLSAGSREYRS